MKTMKVNMWKNAGMGLCLFLLAACSGQTEVADEGVGVADAGMAETEEVVVDTWDENEFNSTFASTNYYEEWDENDDNLLAEDEYTAGLYDTWDVNNDNQIDENEWTTASNNFGLENETWSEWDANGDGILDENEYSTAFADNGWFEEWDADDDNMLAEREYTDGLFGVWDENNNEVLEENEYGYYNTYYGV